MTTVPKSVQVVVDEFIPHFRGLVHGRYAISIGGSYGKGTDDERSDIDFRLFYDELVGGDEEKRIRALLKGLIAEWGARGREIDGYWPRSIAVIDAGLDRRLSGDIERDQYVWTIWGYQLLGDIANQLVLEDPDGVIAGWQRRLDPYPAAVKRSLIAGHLESVRYWRRDYHYANKVERRDLVFLAGLTQLLCHDLVRILFAVNETYYIGDGKNAKYLRGFPIVPEGFADRLEATLYPADGARAVAWQYTQMMELIDSVEKLLRDRGLDPPGGNSSSG